MTKYLLFIPMYNCEKQIPRVLKQIDQRAKSIFNEVIIVNNRSTDQSEEIVREIIANEKFKFKLLRNNENYGLGGSHKVAFRYAIENDFSHIVVLHGDDQGRLADIITHLENGEAEKFDCLLGARFQPGSKLKGYSKFRTFGNIVYNTLFSLVCGQMIYDLGSGLNCYAVRILKDEFFFKFPDDLTFNYCMVMASSYYGHSVKFVPISWREEDQVSNVKLFNQAFRVLKMLQTFAFNKKEITKADWRKRAIKEYSAKVIAQGIAT